MMKKNVILKAKETRATNSDFYNLFRPIAPSINLIGKIAQVVSALTEGVTIWYITQSEMAGQSKFISISVSILCMILVIALLEIGGRKFLQVLTRAIVWKRLKNAWYVSLFSIVLGITLGMGALSFHLSTNGIKHAFESNVPVVAHFDASDLKQEYRTAIKEIDLRFNRDFTLIQENFKDRLHSASANFDAKIKDANLKVDRYNRKFKSGEKWAKSQAEKHLKMASNFEMEKTKLVTGIHAEQAKKIDQWQAKKERILEAEKTKLQAEIDKNEAKISLVHSSKKSNASFWGNLFSYFVGFSVILAFICIVSVEVYRRGAGIEVSYSEEEKDRSILELFFIGIKERFNSFFRRKAEKFAKVSNHSTQNSGMGFKYPSPAMRSEQEEI